MPGPASAPGAPFASAGGGGSSPPRASARAAAASAAGASSGSGALLGLAAAPSGADAGPAPTWQAQVTCFRSVDCYRTRLAFEGRALHLGTRHLDLQAKLLPAVTLVYEATRQGMHVPGHAQGVLDQVRACTQPTFIANPATVK